MVQDNGEVRGIHIHVILSEENAVDVRMNIYFENADHSLTGIASSIYNTISMDVCTNRKLSRLEVYRYGGLNEGDYKIRVNSQNQSYEVNVFPRIVFMHPGDTSLQAICK